MRVIGGPLAGQDVDWTADRVEVPEHLAPTTAPSATRYELPRFVRHVYDRVRPPLEQGDDFYRYVGRTWGGRGSNPRPNGYEPPALTN